MFQEDEESIKKVKKYGEKVICSRLTEDELETLIGDIINTKVLICGTKSFDKDMLNYFTM